MDFLQSTKAPKIFDKGHPKSTVWTKSNLNPLGIQKPRFGRTVLPNLDTYSTKSSSILQGYLVYKKTLLKKPHRI